MEFIDEYHALSWQSALDLLKPTPAQLERGLELHKEIFCMDHFGFLPHGTWNQTIVDKWNELKARNIGQRALSKRIEYMQYDVCCKDPECRRHFRNAMRASGLKCMVQTVAEGKSREEDFRRMSCNIELLRTFSDTIAQAGSLEEIARVNDEGKIAVIWSVNGPPIVGELQDLEQELETVYDWYRVGVRLMHLSYNRRNMIADGCTEAADGGLSDLGRELIKRMNKVGIIADVPHTGRQSSIDAARCSSKPMMASHTAAKALYDFPRCKDDETLKAIAESGGMVGVYAYASMLGGSGDLAMMLNHIDHIVKTIGVDHVGIGTDLSYQRKWGPETYSISGYDNAEFSTRWWGNWNSAPHTAPKKGEDIYGSLSWINWPLYTVGLVTRGYTDDQIAKIQGGNFLRVLAANQPED